MTSLPVISLLNREKVAKAIADRMAQLQENWNAIDDDPSYCEQLEFARGQLDELLNDIIAGDFDVALPISLADLPPETLTRDLIRRATGGDDSIAVHSFPDVAERVRYQINTVKAWKSGEVRYPGIVIAVFGEAS